MLEGFCLEQEHYFLILEQARCCPVLEHAHCCPVLEGGHCQAVVMRCYQVEDCYFQALEEVRGYPRLDCSLPARKDVHFQVLDCCLQVVGREHCYLPVLEEEVRCQVEEMPCYPEMDCWLLVLEEA